jgi:hypothetical protein
VELLKLALPVLVHPVESFEFIKRSRGKFTYKPAIFLFLMMIAVRLAYINIAHYPLSSLEPRDANLWFEIMKFIIPIFTWVLAGYLVTAILSGEAFFGEMFTAAAYSMVPYILFTIPLGLASHIMAGSEAGFYNTLHAIKWIWVILLFVISTKALHNYSLGKTAGICMLTIFAMLLIWAVILLVFALTSQLYKLLEGIVLEIIMLFDR